jgi:hypothetical protein
LPNNVTSYLHRYSQTSTVFSEEHSVIGSAPATIAASDSERAAIDQMVLYNPSEPRRRDEDWIPMHSGTDWLTMSEIGASNPFENQASQAETMTTASSASTRPPSYTSRHLSTLPPSYRSRGRERASTSTLQSD